MMTWQSAVAAPHAFDPRPVGGTHERNDCQCCGGALSRRYGGYYVAVIPSMLSSQELPSLNDPFIGGGCVEISAICSYCYHQGFEP